VGRNPSEEVREVGKVTIELSEDLMDAVRLPPQEVPARLRRELALRLYEKGLLTFGKARELAGMTRWAFHELLGEEGIPRRYDVQEFEEDLKTLRRLD
jgi:predicted HTH domain antitoxin